MSAHVQRLCGTFALSAAFVACRDSSTALQRPAVGSAPSFATAEATTSTSADQSHFNAHGDFASVGWRTSGEGGFTLGSVSVSRGGPAGDAQTFLSYLIQQCDNAFNCSSSGGEGLIPNQDFSAGGQAARLNTNTADIPDFVTFGVIPPGVVSVSWQENGLFQQRRNGTFEITDPGRTLRETGVSSNASADGSGSVVGLSFASNATFFGQLGSASSVTIDIFH
jgi:hypothetical protein